MLPRRLEKLKKMVAQRQMDLTICLENVHDPHNISAVLRSCDAVGIGEIYILNSDPDLANDYFTPGKKSSSGSDKWVNIHIFDDIHTCFRALREKFDLILSTSLQTDSGSLYDLDLTQSMALVFGNEKEGVSREALQLSDANFNIPQVGMVPSLNISVACAVTLYEAFRQRSISGNYKMPASLSTDQTALLQQFVNAHLKNSRP